MSLPPFPREARPILRILRRDVPRPKSLPQSYECERLDKFVLRWTSLPMGDCCPMGLHPEAECESPVIPGEFVGELKRPPREAVDSFAAWFDSIKPTLTNARAVVKFIWPRKVKRSA